MKNALNYVKSFWSEDIYIFVPSFFQDRGWEFFKELYNLFGMKTLIRVQTCYENPANPTCIDLMLTNSDRSFQNSHTIETGLSDSHKMVVIVLKIYSQKMKARVIYYRYYGNFSNEEFIQ